MAAIRLLRVIVSLSIFLACCQILFCTILLFYRPLRKICRCVLPIAALMPNLVRCFRQLRRQPTQITIRNGFSDNFKPKSFWQRPEGVTGILFLSALGIGAGIFLLTSPWCDSYFSGQYGQPRHHPDGIGAHLRSARPQDAGARGLWLQERHALDYRAFRADRPHWHFEGLCGAFAGQPSQHEQANQQVAGADAPVERNNRRNNPKEIQNNLQLASEAKNANNQAQMVLKSRKAGRLEKSRIFASTNCTTKWKCSTGCSSACTKTQRC